LVRTDGEVITDVRVARQIPAQLLRTCGEVEASQGTVPRRIRRVGDRRELTGPQRTGRGVCQDPQEYRACSLGARVNEWFGRRRTWANPINERTRGATYEEHATRSSGKAFGLRLAISDQHIRRRRP